MNRVAKVGAALGALALLCVAAGAVLAAQAGRENEAADAAWNRNDAASAVAHARRAASCYVPGSGAAPAAHARLRMMALALEARGDGESAQLAWRAAIGAAYASRSLVQPLRPALHEAQQASARLALLQRARTSSPLVAGDRDARRAAADEADADLPPRPASGALLLLGAFAWLIGCYRLVVLWGARASFRASEMRWACGVTVLGAIGWTAGLLFA